MAIMIGYFPRQVVTTSLSVSLMLRYIYKGAGHGAIFQRADLFARQATTFYLADKQHINK